MTAVNAVAARSRGGEDGVIDPALQVVPGGGHEVGIVGVVQSASAEARRTIRESIGRVHTGPEHQVTVKVAITAANAFASGRVRAMNRIVRCARVRHSNVIALACKRVASGDSRVRVSRSWRIRRVAGVGGSVDELASRETGVHRTERVVGWASDDNPVAVIVAIAVLRHSDRIIGKSLARVARDDGDASIWSGLGAVNSGVRSSCDGSVVLSALPGVASLAASPSGRITGRIVRKLGAYELRRVLAVVNVYGRTVGRICGGVRRAVRSHVAS